MRQHIHFLEYSQNHQLTGAKLTRGLSVCSMLNVLLAVVLVVEVGARRPVLRGAAAVVGAEQSVQPIILTPLIFRLQ
jgi:hypothetical protein